MSISDWSSDVCSSDLALQNRTYVHRSARLAGDASGQISFGQNSIGAGSQSTELDHTLLTAPCRDLTIHKLPFAHLQLAPLILHNEGLRACYGGAQLVEVRLGIRTDRRRAVGGKSVSVRVDIGGRRINKKK